MEPQTVPPLRPFVSTIFAEITELAVAHDAINLGQGFPDSDGPESMLRAAADAIAAGHNQYPPGAGIPRLRAAVARRVAADTGLDYDPDSEVLVTVGATEAIAGALLGLVSPGDEVVVIEPYYDSYAAVVALAGGVRRTARLVRDGAAYRLDHDSLRDAFSSRTRAVIVNTPHNPTGAVLPAEDLELVAASCREAGAIAISDEVYEHLLFDGREHVSIATLPGMRERTVRISSAAKTFNCTGWKIGWLTGPPELVTAARAAKQYLSYAAGTPLQLAVAHALDHEMAWVSELRDELAARRDQLSGILRDIGFELAETAGTYFVTADPRPLGITDAGEFCRSLPARFGVAAVPFAPFVDSADEWSHLVRFAFCKRESSIAEVGRRLAGLRA